MDSLTPKERLLRVLRKEPVDHPPEICTGGMMNAAIVEIMEQTGNTLPVAHFDAQRMAALAQLIEEINRQIADLAAVAGIDLDIFMKPCRNQVRRRFC